MKTNRKRRQKIRNRLGATAVEFSLTLPILLLFLFATFELGRGNMMINTTEAAAYEACRVAIIPGASPDEAEAIARQILSTSGVKKADFEITPTDLTQDTESVSITLRVSFADNSFLVPSFLDQAIFERTCVLNRERDQ